MIALNSFVRRQTPESRFGHFSGTEEDLLELIEQCWGQQKPGYRAGVLLVPVPADSFYTSVVPLKPGMALGATFQPRHEGEAPRMHVGAHVPITTRPDGSITIDYAAAKVPAVAVDIVLYASTVLAEDKDNELEAVPGNWEVVSINPRCTVEDEPIPPDTLIANHLHESGGTATKMTDEQFVAQLRISRAYWSRFIPLL